MISYKRDVLESQSLSEVKMGRGSPICERVHKKIVEYFKNNVPGVTWPFDGDASLVFHSAHFATYRVILSVNFEPLCIGPIMSASADKGDRKREIEQSPMKKKIQGFHHLQRGPRRCYC